MIAKVAVATCWTGGLVFGLVSVTWMVTVVVPAAFGVPVRQVR